MLEAIEDLGRRREELNRQKGKYVKSPEREPLVGSHAEGGTSGQ